MAQTITYLLVSGTDDVDAVQNHPVIATSDFAHRETREASSEQIPAVTFAVEHALEEETDLKEKARELSTEFSEAVIVLCEVEERFEHVERLQNMIFIGGKHAGKIEHGYVFNVG